MAPAPNDKSDSTSETPAEAAAGYLLVIFLSLVVILFFMFICAILDRLGVFDVVGCWIKYFYTRIRAGLNRLSLKKAKTEGREPQDTSTVRLQYMVPSSKPTHDPQSPTDVPHYVQ
ncbi:hypothetical protein PCH_Pc13g10190 [Penicillium rubens Wisconsin 54-1255]|uniref:Uncharacterized protein n=1 Tax=Penicillium rubens (strain ATCC 28089 / DSM 1075 / NRRL 1951 / Wisconsin 54-1255) TaxID=500485 RepID=B6H4R9_PENRW|nr:hypothetical protein PCH_Pc13g10190 [Penicillium rubens Wisconsin 54-1255]